MSACSLITSSIPLNNAVRYWDLMNALQRINWTYGRAGVSLHGTGKNGTWNQFPQCPVIKYWEPNQQQQLPQSKGEDPGVSSQQHPEPWMGAVVPGGGMDPLGCAMEGLRGAPLFQAWEWRQEVSFQVEQWKLMVSAASQLGGCGEGGGEKAYRGSGDENSY